MKNRYEREQELINSGLVDSIKYLYNGNPNISEEYIMLIADYVDSISEVKDSLHIDPIHIAKTLPTLLHGIREDNIGAHGVTDNNLITMNKNLDYETKKLFFFHELTHAIQSKKINNQEICSFYDGNDGMFLTEGATQFTAEILYHISNGTNINYRDQTGVVRGQSNHITYSPLSEYQLNGNILMLLSKSINLPLPEILAMGYRTDGRYMLKSWYETYPNDYVSFDQLMSDLEKIYSIDKLVIAGYSNQLQGEPVKISMQNGQTFFGSLEVENQLIVKTERNLASNFFLNNDENYILNNYQEFCNYLTTPQLKKEFLNAVKVLQIEVNKNNINNQNNMSFNYTMGFTNIMLTSIILLLFVVLVIVFII